MMMMTMMIVVPSMQGVYDVLAFVVALFFPLALLTWLVIDKFIPEAEDANSLGPQHSGRDHHSRALADRSHHGA